MGFVNSLREHVVALVLVVLITALAIMAIDLLPVPTDVESLFSQALTIGVALLAVPFVAGAIGGLLMGKRGAKLKQCAMVAALGAAIATVLVFAYSVVGPAAEMVAQFGAITLAVMLCVNIVLNAVLAALGGMLGGAIAKRKHA